MPRAEVDQSRPGQSLLQHPGAGPRADAGDLAAQTLARSIPAPVEPGVVPARGKPWPLGPVTGRSTRGRIIRGLERVLCWSGAAGGFAAVTKAAGAIILNYHSVAPDHERDLIEPTFSMSVKAFQRQIDFLAIRRRVVPLSGLVDDLEQGRTPERGTVCLTFDDAYRNTLTTAAPILAKRGLPATLFVPTGMVDRGENPWLDTICHAIRRRTRHALSLPEVGLPDLRFTGRPDDTALLRRLNRAFLPLDLATRDAALANLHDQLRPTPPLPRLVMEWRDLQHLRAEYPLMEVGAHGIDHIDLTAASAGEASRQVLGSLASIEQRLGIRPTLFSCPYDRSSAEVAGLLAAAGYRASASAGGQPLLTASSDRLRLARITATASLTLTRFYTSGAHPALPRLLFGRSQ